MSKEAYYFSHDSNARIDDKIIALRMKHGWEGYGLYWALIEKLRESKDYTSVCNYNTIAYDLRTDSAKIKSIIEDFRLFAFTGSDFGKCFYSESLKNRMDKKSNRARENANKRWSKDATAMQPHATAMQKDAIKVKESKGKNSIKDKYKNISFVSVENLNEFYKNFEGNKKYFLLAYRFWEVWKKENPNHKTLNDANIGSWYDAIRLIVEVDNQKTDRLILVWKFFEECHKHAAGFDRFWLENTMSLPSLRKTNENGVYKLDSIVDRANTMIEKNEAFNRLVVDAIKIFNNESTKPLTQQI